MTTMSTARATVDGIDSVERKKNRTKPLQEYQSMVKVSKEKKRALNRRESAGIAPGLKNCFNAFKVV
ncbi:MAG: hypothetical protein WC695_00335 [Candidatus Omnitrophota bacterium]